MSWSPDTEWGSVEISSGTQYQKLFLVPSERRTSHQIPISLSEVTSFSSQLRLIARDLIHVLIGFEALYIKFDKHYDPNLLLLRLSGAEFRVSRHLDPALKGIVQRLVQYGSIFVSLNAFVEAYNLAEYGKTMQALSYGVSRFLHRYKGVVANLDLKLAASTLSLKLLERLLDLEVGQEMRHLQAIAAKIHAVNSIEMKHAQRVSSEPGEEIMINDSISAPEHDLVTLASEQRGFKKCKGTLVFQVIQERLDAYLGDHLSVPILSSLFTDVSAPYLSMLNAWLIQGELDDPFLEFLVKKASFSDDWQHMLDPKSEHYWSRLYVVRQDGLTGAFAAKSTQQQILNTGKYLNIFKQVTGLKDIEFDKDDLEPVKSINSVDFHLQLNILHDRANKLLIRLLFDGLNLQGSIDEMQTVFLFQDCFGIDEFLARAFTDLKCDIKRVSVSRLKSKEHEAFKAGVKIRGPPNSSIARYIREHKRVLVASMSFFDEANDISGPVDDADFMSNGVPSFKAFIGRVVSMDPPQLALTIDSERHDPDPCKSLVVSYLNLAVDLPFPANLVINEEYMYHYGLAYKIRIISKFLTYLNTHTWRDICGLQVWRHDFSGSARKSVRRARAIHWQMRTLTQEIQLYFLCDVGDESFAVLKRDLNQIRSMLNVSNTQGLPSYESGFPGSRNDCTCTVESLTQSVGRFVSVVLVDSLVTLPQLLDALCQIFDTIITYNNFLARLKHVLVLCDETLFATFLHAKPENFADSMMDTSLVAARHLAISDALTKHQQALESSITRFTVVCGSHTESNNEKIRLLGEVLGLYVPMQN